MIRTFKKNDLVEYVDLILDEKIRAHVTKQQDAVIWIRGIGENKDRPVYHG